MKFDELENYFRSCQMLSVV